MSSNKNNEYAIDEEHVVNEELDSESVSKSRSKSKSYESIQMNIKNSININQGAKNSSQSVSEYDSADQ